MQNKKNMSFFSFLVISVFMAVSTPAVCADVIDEEIETMSADAVANYDVTGSVFEQITGLEQEKVLMQLEIEREQLDLELDKLAAENIRMNMEIDSLSGRAEQQQQELENAQAKLEAEAEKLEREKQALAEQVESAAKQTVSTETYSDEEKTDDVKFADVYRLVNVFGSGSQLQATIKDLNTGQNKRIAVGKKVDGYTVKSISLYEGVVFEKDGDVQILNVVSTADK